MRNKLSNAIYTMRLKRKIAIYIIFVILILFFITISADAVSLSDSSDQESQFIVKINTENMDALSQADCSPILENMDEIYSPQGIFLTDSYECIETLNNMGILDSYEEDGVMLLDSIEQDKINVNEEDYRSAMLGYNYIHNLNITCSGISIAIIDSGLQNDFSLFTNANIIPGINITADIESPDRSNTDDTLGHGTHVASIICGETIGLADDVTIVPIKCTDTTTVSYSYVIQSIYTAVDSYNCNVINMSLGGTMQCQELDNAINYAISSGAIVVAANGNIQYGNSSGNDDYYYPASCDGVISVGAVCQDKSIWPKSVQNDKLDVVVPGVNVSAFVITNGKNISECSGTSFSAPVVSALAALALAYDNTLDNKDFLELIKSTSEDLGDKGYDSSYGNGLLNPALLLAKLTHDENSFILSYYNGCYCISNYSDNNVADTNVICFYDANDKFMSAEYCNTLCNYIISDDANYITLISLDVNCKPIKKMRIY